MKIDFAVGDFKTGCAWLWGRSFNFGGHGSGRFVDEASPSRSRQTRPVLKPDGRVDIGSGGKGSRTCWQLSVVVKTNLITFAAGFWKGQTY